MLSLPLDHFLNFSRDHKQVRDLVEATCFLPNDNTNNTAIIYTQMSQDSSFSVSPCWLFVGVWVAPTLSVRTFTMPSGQSGRTLWNVPKLSNRFQVLRATGQPPTITPLCVSCVIGLPAQQSKLRHFSSKRERAELRNGYPSLLTVKSLLVFTMVSYLLFLWFTLSLLSSKWKF